MFYKNLLIIFLIAINVYVLLNLNDLKKANKSLTKDLNKNIKNNLLNNKADNYQIAIKKDLNTIFYFYDKKLDKNINKLISSKKYKKHLKFSLDVNDKKSYLLYKKFNLNKLPIVIVGNNLSGFKIIKHK